MMSIFSHRGLKHERAAEAAMHKAVAAGNNATSHMQ